MVDPKSNMTDVFIEMGDLDTDNTHRENTT